MATSKWKNEDGTRTDEKLAIDYVAIGHGVEVINSIVQAKKVGGNGPDKDMLCIMNNETDDHKKEIVSINVTLLEQMVAKTDWGSEDMTDANKAITDGKAYVG
jgi:hypothetical protein